MTSSDFDHMTREELIAEVHGLMFDLAGMMSDIENLRLQVAAGRCDRCASSVWRSWGKSMTWEPDVC